MVMGGSRIVWKEAVPLSLAFFLFFFAGRLYVPGFLA
jgi:hypothetical protein